jgi:hypothetical protein
MPGTNGWMSCGCCIVLISYDRHSWHTCSAPSSTAPRLSMLAPRFGQRLDIVAYDETQQSPLVQLGLPSNSPLPPKDRRDAQPPPPAFGAKFGGVALACLPQAACEKLDDRPLARRSGGCRRSCPPHCPIINAYDFNSNSLSRESFDKSTNPSIMKTRPLLFRWSLSHQDVEQNSREGLALK